MNFKFKFDRHFYVFLIFLRSTAFWFAWLLFRPEIPFSVALMYREHGQDIEYFPHMAGFANHGLRDAYDYLHHGTGFVSFPAGSIWLHSLLFKLGGVSGFVLADFLVAVSVFFLLAAVLKQFKVSDFISNTLSLFVVIGVSGKLTGLSKSLHLLLNDRGTFFELSIYFAFVVGTALFFFRKNFSRWVLAAIGSLLLFSIAYETWEYFAWRFPRPFVTEVYFLAFALLSLRMMKLDDIFAKKSYWVGLGVTTALLLESEIYRFFLCGLLLIALALSKLNQKTNWKKVFECFCIFILPFSFLAVPFILQRMNENPDVPRRFGAFAVSRWEPMLKAFSAHDLYTLTLLVVIFGFGFAQMKKRFAVSEQVNVSRRNFALICVYFLAVFSLPLFMILSGKMIQPEHFYHQLKHMTTLMTLIGIGFLITEWRHERNLASNAETPSHGKLKAMGIYLAIALVALVDIAKDAHKAYSFTDHTRNDFGEYQHFPDYLKHYSSLIQQLQKPEFNSSLSMATFDMQVSEWWNTIKGGRSFFSDELITSLSDAELEDRLITVTRLLGFSADEFIDFVNEPMTNLFFFSTLKYRFSNGYLFSDWNDYSPQAQASYRSTGEFSSFFVEMPTSERTRLKAKFMAAPKAVRENSPDLLVLQAHSKLSLHQPDSSLYQPVYSDEVFRVWLKK